MGEAGQPPQEPAPPTAAPPVAEEPAAPPRSPFKQVLYRRTGEAFDLGGKAAVGVAGFGSLLTAHRAEDVNWIRFLVGFAFGSVLLAVGIYLQAKAEEV